MSMMFLGLAWEDIDKFPTGDYLKGQNSRGNRLDVACAPGQAMTLADSHGGNAAWAGRIIGVRCSYSKPWITNTCEWTAVDKMCRKMQDGTGLCLDTNLECPGGVVSGLAYERDIGTDTRMPQIRGWKVYCCKV